MDFWYDAIFGHIFGADNWTRIKEIMGTLAKAVERDKEGQAKKRAVIEMTMQWIIGEHGQLPVPPWIARLLLGIVVDSIVAYYNQEGWDKDIA